MELTRKNKGFEWFLWLAIALWACSLNSCGAKEKSLQVSKTKTEEQKDLSVFNQKQEIGRVELIKLDGEIIIRPIDVKQPYRINNDVFDNVTIHIKQKKVDSVATREKTETTETKDKGVLKTDSIKKDLQVESEGVNVTGISWSIWGIVVLIILGVIIYFFRGIIFKKDPNVFD